MLHVPIVDRNCHDNVQVLRHVLDTYPLTKKMLLLITVMALLISYVSFTVFNLINNRNNTEINWSLKDGDFSSERLSHFITVSFSYVQGFLPAVLHFSH